MRSKLKIAAILTVLSLFVGCIGSYAYCINPIDYASWDNEAPPAPAVPTPEPSPTPTPTPQPDSYREVEIGSARTTYGLAASQANRNTNMTLAAKAIDGLVLNNGELFSFNSVVGPRTTERGYREATIFVGQEKEPGIGGGICQISSTIYMAAKKVNLQIVERHPHSIPVSYCVPDDEATVSWGYLDLKLRNNTGDPIRFEATCSGGVVRVRIFQRVPVY